MHAVMITFTAAAPLDDLAAPFQDYARALHSVDGLQTKTWIANGSTLGGFHVFDNRAAAETYLGSELAAGLMATEGFTDFEVEHFDVLTELSALTGIEAREPLSA